MSGSSTTQGTVLTECLRVRFLGSVYQRQHRPAVRFMLVELSPNTATGMSGTPFAYCDFNPHVVKRSCMQSAASI